MTSKIDVRMIFQDHFATMRDEATQKTSRLDLFTMAAIPLILAVASLLLCFEISDDHVGTLISVFSIMAGLLFNVLVLIYSVSDHIGLESDREVRDELLRQTFANISYTILICLIAVACLAILLFASGWAQVAVSGLCVLLTANFAASILMILKRLHVLLRSKFPAK